MTRFPDGFLWGASTSPHQTEGNNVLSDWWAREGMMPGMEPSGDAVDSYHRYAEDIELLAAAGLNSYRFGIEWARIEPRPGQFSLAELSHYRRMIDTSLSLGLTPVVTLNHFTVPAWFAEEGGWMGLTAEDRFSRFVQRAAEILADVPYVITVNEPNILALMVTMMEAMATGQADEWQSPTVEGGDAPQRVVALPTPSTRIGKRLGEIHVSVRELLHANTDAKVGWSVANQAFTPTPGNEATHREVQHQWEDLYLEVSRGDDFVGVQSYSSQPVDENGPVPHPPHPDNTLVGSAYRPDALAIAVRHTAEVTDGIPILVTENGIATADDTRRISYTHEALGHLNAAMHDGIDVRGYLHWSLLDNFEWGHWAPTFGLIAVDRTTFARTPKPSLGWLGRVAATGIPDTGEFRASDAH